MLAECRLGFTRRQAVSRIAVKASSMPRGCCLVPPAGTVADGDTGGTSSPGQAHTLSTRHGYAHMYTCSQPRTHTGAPTSKESRHSQVPSSPFLWKGGLVITYLFSSGSPFPSFSLETLRERELSVTQHLSPASLSLQSEGPQTGCQGQ